MDSHIGSIGFVARNYTCTIILAGARRFPGILVSITIEALTLRTSIEELLRMDHQKLIFEGGCQILINAINSSSSEDRDAGLILEDIFNLVSNFSEIKFQFVSRTCNWVAHSVAKKPLSMTASAYLIILFWNDSLVLIEESDSYSSLYLSY
ncbi:uncharacterized protein LOC126687808 [Mercurialis annua]|uniref:uncharacterized protein LOC126687808 n=1 Tax=Mercurialis annua TaxID=3986 RepID=UPI0021608423|nr:uncharacterized protein LOC126687808 [Mercurialis annua]